MRPCLVNLLIVSLWCTTSVLADKPADGSRIQGKWKVAKAQWGGWKPKESIVGKVWAFHELKRTIEAKSKVIMFTLPRAKKHKQLKHKQFDLVGTNPESGKREVLARAIFRFEGDHLVICVLTQTGPGRLDRSCAGPRPTSFDPKKRPIGLDKVVLTLAKVR